MPSSHPRSKALRRRREPEIAEAQALLVALEAARMWGANKDRCVLAFVLFRVTPKGCAMGGAQKSPRF